MRGRTLIRFSKSRENIFHGHGGKGVFLDAFFSEVTAAVVRTRPRRPGLAIGGRHDSGPQSAQTSRTQHSCRLWRPRSAELGGCAGEQAPVGPDTRSFPVPWPVEERRAHLRQGRGQLGSAHGRGGSSGVSSSVGAALRQGSGGPGMVLWHQARNPGDSFRLISSGPPTHRRSAARYWHRGQKKSGRGRRPIKASGCRGCGQGHTRADL